MITGKHLKGRDEIFRYHDELPKGVFKDHRGSAELKDLRFIPADIAIGRVAFEGTSADGGAKVKTRALRSGASSSAQQVHVNCGLSNELYGRESATTTVRALGRGLGKILRRPQGHHEITELRLSVQAEPFSIGSSSVNLVTTLWAGNVGRKAVILL